MPEVAISVATPGSSAVTSPLASVSATRIGTTRQVTGASIVSPVGETTRALNCSMSPTLRLASVGSISSRAMFGCEGLVTQNRPSLSVFASTSATGTSVPMGLVLAPGSAA